MEGEVRFAVLYLRLSKDHVHAEESLRSQESALRERAAMLGLAVRAVVSEGAGRSAYGTGGGDVVTLDGEDTRDTSSNSEPKNNPTYGPLARSTNSAE